MNLEELKTLYETRQSCRSYEKKEIPAELLQEVMEMALLAPSACNYQPWKLICATGETKNKLFDEAMSIKGININKFVTDVPALIVVCSNEDERNKGKSVKEFVPFDLGGLTSHLVLAAEVAGLSTCILGWRDTEKVKKVLSLPEDTSIPVIVAIGYEKEGYEVRKKVRKPVSDCIEYRD